jgi:predicted acyltransferase
MVFVDNLRDPADGTTPWPALGHTPWDGLHLADVVMPLFLVVLGIAVPLTLRRHLSRGETIGWVVKKIWQRALKLLVLGLVLQGGGLPQECDSSLGDVCAGWDLNSIRLPGVLQRIALVYLVISLTALSSMLTTEPAIEEMERRAEDSWDPSAFAEEASDQERMRALLGNREVGVTIGVGMSTDTGDSGPPLSRQLCDMLRNLRRFVLSWVMVALLVFMYVCLTALTKVPSYHNSEGAEVACNDRRGETSVACNAVGYYDRLYLTPRHMDRREAFVGLSECTNDTSPTNSSTPSFDPPPYCSVAFDSYGITSMLGSVVTALYGVYLAQVLMAEETVQRRLWQWLPLSLLLLGVGVALDLSNAVRFNRNLWSISYLLSTAGAAGLLFALLHATVDRPARGKDTISSSPTVCPSHSARCHAPAHWNPLSTVWSEFALLRIVSSHPVCRGGAVTIVNHVRGGGGWWQVSGKALGFLTWLGSNSILLYVLHTLHAPALYLFYFRAADNNLYTGQGRLFAHMLSVDGGDCSSSRACTMVLSLVRCVVWVALAGLFHLLDFRWVV